MKKLLVYLKDYKVESIVGPLFKLLEACFEQIVPLLVAEVINTAIPAGDAAAVRRTALIMVLLGVLGLVCSITAQYFGNLPVVFAKKAKSKNIDGEVYTSTVHSYTYGRDYDITLAKKFLGPADRVLILDDFLANGKAMRGLLDVCRQAGATVAGIGVCIEKGFQPGGAELRAEGYRVASLAIVDAMGDDGSLTFRRQED